MSQDGHIRARIEAEQMLIRALPGTRSNVVRRAELAGVIGEAIWRRWQVGVQRWQLKHVEWYLDDHIAQLAQSTRYDHWRTLRALLSAMDKQAWIGQMMTRKNATYLRPTAVAGPLMIGRPAKLPRNRSHRTGAGEIAEKSRPEVFRQSSKTD